MHEDKLERWGGIQTVGVSAEDEGVTTMWGV